jgi:hypothetical protein
MPGGHIAECALGVPESFEEHMGLMFDLLVVAYQST